MTVFMQLDLRDDSAEPDGDEIATMEQLLSTRQQIVMLSLLAGETQRMAARRAGVREETVSRWVNDDSAFMQLFAMRQRDVWKAFEARIASMIEPALAAVEYLTRGREYAGEEYYDPAVRLRAAETVLKMAGLLPTGTRVASFGGQVNVGDRQINVSGDRKL